MPHYIFESRVLKKIDGLVAGVDEAGRGPLAGPVVAAAVILNRAKIPKGLNDSKQLRRSGATNSFPTSCSVRLPSASARRASTKSTSSTSARQRTGDGARSEGAEVPAAFALVDGNDAPALPCPCDTIVEGDAKSVSIAAASIIAKVTRDRLMAALDTEDPRYGWARNKGYGTPQHLSALSQFGPTPHHRRSFAPVHNILYGGNPEDSTITL